MIKELENFFVSSDDASKPLKIGKESCEPMKGLLRNILAPDLDVFAWKHEDMIKIDPKVVCYA